MDFTLNEIGTFFCDLYLFANNKNNIKQGFDKSNGKYLVYDHEEHIASSIKGLERISDRLLSIPKENQLPYAKLIISSIDIDLSIAERNFNITEEDFYRPGKKYKEPDYIMVEQKDGSFTCIADIARCSFYIVKDLGPVECSYIKDEIIEFVYGIGEIFSAFDINIYDEAKKIGYSCIDKYDPRYEENENDENKMKSYETNMTFNQIFSHQYINHTQELKDILKTKGFIDNGYKWRRSNGYSFYMLGKIHRYLKDNGVILSTPSISATVIPFCSEFGIELETKKSSNSSISRRSMQCSYTNDDQLEFDSIFKPFINRYKQ